MTLFRRKPLHVRLAEEGGLVEQPAPVSPGPHWGEVGIHGVARARRWDEVAAAETAGPDGDRVEFVVLPDGTLLGEQSEVPLADALSLDPPYRAEAVRRGPQLWAVAARRIEVVELPEDTDGEDLQLTLVGGNRTLVVDGEPAFGSVPALERLREGDFAVHATRLDERLWEAEVSRL